MADVDDIESTEATRLVGADRNSDGDETTPVGSTTDGELFIRDTHDNGGLDTILNLTTTPSEGKTGATRKPNCKYVIFQALTKKVKWGFTNSTQSFDIFKRQLFMVPLGENTEIWFSASSGTAQVAFGELS